MTKRQEADTKVAELKIFIVHNKSLSIRVTAQVQQFGDTVREASLR